MRISWERLTQDILSCEGCGLAAGCTRKVPGQGDASAPLMLIGEGPASGRTGRGWPLSERLDSF